MPTESMQAIANTVANPRVAAFLEGADPIFAEQAATETVDDFRDWLRQWERLADEDGTQDKVDRAHQRRNLSLTQSDIDSSWMLRGGGGALQGAVLNKILTRYEDAEFQADWDEAKQRLGRQPGLEELARTPAQRRWDALVNIFRQAASTPANASSPEPLVNIVMSQEAFEAELARLAGGDADLDPADADAHRCHTDLGDDLPAARGGHTNTDNGDIYCGVHNRLKEHGFTPTRQPDGTWTIHRPDGTPITPAV